MNNACRESRLEILDLTERRDNKQRAVCEIREGNGVHIRFPDF